LHKNEEFGDELILLYQAFKNINPNIKIYKFGFYKIKIYWSYDQKCIILILKVTHIIFSVELNFIWFQE